MDAQLFVQGTWETPIGVGHRLAQVHIGEALVPAGVVRYTRADGRISGTVENDPDAPSDFPPEALTTDEGMIFTGRFYLTCYVGEAGSGHYTPDENFESTFCQQFAHLGPEP